MTGDEIETFAKFGALWAALPTAIVGLIAILVQGFVGSRQAAAARLSATASSASAEAAEATSRAALRNADLKESELERDAVKSLSLQRRVDLAELRTALIELHSLVFDRTVWNDVEKSSLSRVMGEIRMRVMPNSKLNEDLLGAASTVFACAIRGDAKAVNAEGAQFIKASQLKLYNDLRLIEKQIQVGKID